MNQLKRPCQCLNCGRFDREEGIVKFDDVGEKVYCFFFEIYVAPNDLCEEYLSIAW